MQAGIRDGGGGVVRSTVAGPRGAGARPRGRRGGAETRDGAGRGGVDGRR